MIKIGIDLSFFAALRISVWQARFFKTSAGSRLQGLTVPTVVVNDDYACCISAIAGALRTWRFKVAMSARASKPTAIIKTVGMALML